VGLLWQIVPSGYCGGWSSNACPQVIGEVIRLLTGDWRVGGQDAVLAQPNGGIIYRFHARDLHLVLGPAPDGKPVKFQVLIDGHVPGADHGVDVDANGDGIIKRQRLYQLVRLTGDVTDHTFEISFPRFRRDRLFIYVRLNPIQHWQPRLQVAGGRSRYDHHDGLHSGTLRLPQ